MHCEDDNYRPKSEDLEDISKMPEDDTKWTVGQVYFDAEPPYCRAFSNNDFYEVRFFRIPQPLAIFCAKHKGFTAQGIKDWQRRAVNEHNQKIKDLLGIE